MVLTSIGEVGINSGDKTFVLRPSLANIAKLGSPVEIVQLFHYVMNGIDASTIRFSIHGEEIKNKKLTDYVSACVDVMWSCCDDDISHITGYRTDRGAVMGSMPIYEIIILAQHLLAHGIIGVQSENIQFGNSGGGSYETKFDPVATASLAMAHLSLSERDAWNMTMTSLLNALAVKYPPQKNGKIDANNLPSKEQLEAELKEHWDWHENIKAARLAQQGG